WIDLLVPRGVPAGTYRGAAVVVSVAGQRPARLPITIRVLPLTLPSSPPLAGGFDINPNKPCERGAHDCDRVPGGPAAVTALYARVALDNRVSLAKPPAFMASGPKDPNYRTHARPLLVGSAPTRLRGARLGTVTIYPWAVEQADEWRRIA